MICVCPVCNKKFEARTGAINRALKNGYDIRCGIECAGIARRANKTIRQKKEEKRLSIKFGCVIVRKRKSEI